MHELYLLLQLSTVILVNLLNAFEFSLFYSFTEHPPLSLPPISPTPRTPLRRPQQRLGSDNQTDTPSDPFERNPYQELLSFRDSQAGNNNGRDYPAAGAVGNHQYPNYRLPVGGADYQFRQPQRYVIPSRGCISTFHHVL